MKYTLVIYAYGIACILFSICATNRASDGHDNSMHSYIWANYNRHNGNSDTARDWYTDLIENNGSIYSYKGYIHHLHETHNYPKIIEVMDKVKDIYSNDPDLQLIFFYALQATNNTQKANDLIISLTDRFKTHMEIVFEAAKMYVSRKELENAVRVIDELLNNAPAKPNFFIFHFLKAQIYMQLNQYEKALSSIEKTVSIHPNFDKGWLLFGILHEQKGKLEKAVQGYTHYLQETTDHNDEIKKHLLALTLKAQLFSPKTNIFVPNKSCYEKALFFFKQKQYEPALEKINNCLEDNVGSNDEITVENQLLKIQILHAMNKDEEAVNALLAWLHGNRIDTQKTQQIIDCNIMKRNNNILLSMLHRLALIGSSTTLVINAFEQLHQKEAHNLWPAIYLADLYTRINKQDKALLYHEKALKLTTDNLLKAKISFQMCIAYYDQKKFEPMVTILEKIIDETPSFSPALNLLAYYYATEKKNLTKAQDLIEKAVALSPNNPHFLDTQATILYKNKQYEKAYKILMTIAHNAPHDALILIHLAQTQHQLGDIKTAVKTIKIAQNYTHTLYEKNKADALLQQWNK